MTAGPPTDTALDVPAQAGAAPGGAVTRTYYNMLLTDVQTDRFRATLPMSVQEYIQHIKTASGNVRQELHDYWIPGAADCLSHHLKTMRAEESLTIATGSEDNKDAQKRGQPDFTVAEKWMDKEQELHNRPRADHGSSPQQQEMGQDEQQPQEGGSDDTTRDAATDVPRGCDHLHA